MGKIKLKYGHVEDYTIVLSTRDYRHQGQIVGIKGDTVESSMNLNSANELSFTVCKFDMIDDKNFLSDIEYKRYCQQLNILWENIVDFKLVWVKELDEYYEIRVFLDDAAETIKTVTATSLCEAELSHINIDALEINTDLDIEIQSDNYEGTVFYNEENPKFSLLHRVLEEKAPHYSIKHVDDSLKNIVRTFSVSGTSIYDFLTGEVAEQFNCLFVFDTTDRSISVYDLYEVCNECGHRDEEFEDGVCPECGSSNVYRFGTDTTIYVDKDNLTDSIRVETNADEVKNSLKLEAADELMTSTIQLLNPNGSKYLYAFTEYQMKDMPEDLVNRLNEYNQLCEDYAEPHAEFVENYYQLNDDKWYLESEMMPTIEHYDSLNDITNPRPSVVYTIGNDESNYRVYTYDIESDSLIIQKDLNAEYYMNLFPKIDAITAKSEGDKLTNGNLDTISVTSLSNNTSVTTINTAIKNYAKIFVKTGYVKVEVDTTKVENEYENTFTVNSSTDSDGYTTYTGVWKGRFIVTNYSDEEDVYTTNTITVNVDTNYENFLKQKALKETFDEDEDGSIFNVLNIDATTEEGFTTFKNALTFYGLNRLESFYSAIEGAMTALQSAGQAESGAELYDNFYTPYYNQLNAITEEMNKRQAEIDAVTAEIDAITGEIDKVQKELDFKAFLEKDGKDYYKVFCMYRREDTYSNENYSSEGLSNADVIKKAKEFLEVAKQELKRISEPQITITSSLKNFLVIPEFEPLLKYFELGNWIKIKADGVLYKKVRLIGYSISFGNLQEIGVQFASVTKEKSIANEAKEIIQSAKSMSSSFNYVSKQAEQGSAAKESINDVTSNGLNSGLIQIKNNNNEEVTYGKHGILCREYDDTIGEYSPEQVRFTHNIMAYTKDGWASTEQIIGKHSYLRYDSDTNEWVTDTGYGMTAKFITADGQILGAVIVGGIIYSENYSNGTNERSEKMGSMINLNTGEFEFAGGNLSYIDGVFSIKIPEGDVVDILKGATVTAENLSVNAEKIIGYIPLSKIEGTQNSLIQSGQIESLDSSKISGDIVADSVEARNITTGNGKISSSQIESIMYTQIDGEIPLDKIYGTSNGIIQSEQIEKYLNNKTVTGSFEGAATLSSVTTTNTEGNTYNTITGEFTVGNMIMKFVNGLLVNSTPVENIE